MSEVDEILWPLGTGLHYTWFKMADGSEVLVEEKVKDNGLFPEAGKDISSESTKSPIGCDEVKLPPGVAPIKKQ